MPTVRVLACRRVRSALASCLLLLCSSAFAADPTPPAPPAILDQIPSDATVAIVIPSVKDLGSKISNAATRLNIPFPLPPDLGGFAARNLGITKGFDEAGSAAIIITKPTKPGTDLLSNPTSPPAVILLPTTSAKDMLEPFSPGTPDSAGISEVTLPGDTAEKGYVASNDHYVIFAQDKDVLSAYLARTSSLSKTLTPEELKTFAANDLIVRTSFASLGPATSKLLENIQQEVMGKFDLDNMTKGTDPVAAAAGKEAMNQYFLALKEFTNDADSSLITLRLSDTNIIFGMAGTFKSGTPFADFVAAQKPTKGKELTFKGLPAGEFLVAGAFSYDPKSLSTVIGNVENAVLSNDTVAKDDKAEQIRKFADDYRKVVALASGISYVVLPGASEGKGPKVTATFLIDSPDPKKLLTTLNDLLKAPPAPNPADDVQYTISNTPNAVTIRDVKLSKIHVMAKLRAETPDHPLPETAKQSVRAFEQSFGPEGLSIYNGVIGSRMISIIGSDQATLEGSVDAALTNNESLSTDPQIAAVNDQLVANPVAIVYLPVTRWVKLAVGGAAAGQPGAPAPNIPDAPPIVLNGGVSGSTFTGEIILPMQTVSAIYDFYTMMMGAKSAAPAPGAAPTGP